jgi:flagellar basal-body rod protein FlgB
MMKLFDVTEQLLEANLDRRTTRHRLISRNISNMDTPGYEGTGLEFEKQLRAAMDGAVSETVMAKTHPGHMPQEPPRPFDEARPKYMNTGPVHLDIEMSKLAENNIMFNAMVQLLGRKFTALKSAIGSDGGSK